MCIIVCKTVLWSKVSKHQTFFVFVCLMVHFNTIMTKNYDIHLLRCDTHLSSYELLKFFREVHFFVNLIFWDVKFIFLRREIIFFWGIKFFIWVVKFIFWCVKFIFWCVKFIYFLLQDMHKAAILDHVLNTLDLFLMQKIMNVLGQMK